MAETWTNQTEIRSESSSRVYVVAEKVVNGVPTGTWGCSCPGWKGHGGQCKHLSTLGLRSCRERVAAVSRGRRAVAKPAHNSFSDDAYSHYDTANGFGSPDEWIRMAEQRAQGRGRYQRPRRFVPSHADDLRLLNLTAMPADAKALVKAFRKQAYIDHPDRQGGDTERFKLLVNAYERLLDYYPKGTR